MAEQNQEIVLAIKQAELGKRQIEEQILGLDTSILELQKEIEVKMQTKAGLVTKLVESEKQMSELNKRLGA